MHHMTLEGAAKMRCSMQEALHSRIRGSVTWRVPAASMHYSSPCHHTWIEKGETGDSHTWQASCIWNTQRSWELMFAYAGENALCVVACLPSVCFPCSVPSPIFQFLLPLSCCLISPRAYFLVVSYNIMSYGGCRLASVSDVWIWDWCRTIARCNSWYHTETKCNKLKHTYTTYMLIIPSTPFHSTSSSLLVLNYCTCRSLSTPTQSAAVLCHVISCHILVHHMPLHVITMFHVPIHYFHALFVMFTAPSHA